MVYVNQDLTPPFALQPSFASPHYPVSQSKPADAPGSAGIKPSVKPQLGNGHCCLHWWVNGATRPGPSWVFLAPVEDY